MYYPRLSLWLARCLLASLCTSCIAPRDLLRLNDATLSPAIAAAPKTLVVLQPLKHRVNSYPAGRYIAKLSDGKGIYYEAPEKVIQKDFVAGAGTVIGGFYFSVGRPLEIRSYVEYNGQPIKVLGEITDLSYHFEK